ncbi:MAG: hypothetical protein QXW97_00945 [Candidatus Pacearchaeota archaeon]
MVNLILIGIVSVTVVIITLLIVMWLIAKSKGKIDIILDNYNYSPGDTINGKINLIIKKPVKAKELNIRLIGKRTDIRYNTQQRRNDINENTIFDFKQIIAGEKEYQPSEQTFDFKIKIPQDINKKIEGLFGNIVKTAQILSGSTTQIKWYLIANLEIPGINISKKVQVNIV